ncbi:MAG: shikimate kinase [Acidobacteriota bacterium]
MPHIYLTGFMGCGKTTVGEMLAQRLKRSFLDLDASIEEGFGMTIAEIFETQGEAAFRQLEGQALRRADSQPPAVIALGGGAFSSSQNRALIGQNGVSVWLQVDPEEAAQRCLGLPGRPLAQDPEGFAQLHRRRLPDYARADIHISTRQRTPEQVCAAILIGLAEYDVC